MIQEIFITGECIRISTPVQTPKQKKDHIKDAKKRITELWGERRQFQKELDVLKKSLRGVSKRKQRFEYDSISARIKDTQKKITVRENIIHDDIRMIKDEESWLNHEKEKDQRLKKALRAKRIEIARLDSKTR